MDHSYLTYCHRAGYGRDDHMADEIIARAARRLGADADDTIAQHVGLASHAVPMPTLDVRTAYSVVGRRRMALALRAAFAEMPFRADCRIDIVRLRTRQERNYRVTERWVGGREWVPESAES